MNKKNFLGAIFLLTMVFVFSTGIVFSENDDSINKRIEQEEFLCVTTPGSVGYGDVWIDVNDDKDFTIVDPYITVFFGPSKDIDDNTRIRSNYPNDDYEIIVDKKDFDTETYFYGIEKLDLLVSDVNQKQLVIEQAEKLVYFSEQLEKRNEGLTIDVTKAEIIFDKGYRPVKFSLFYNYIKAGETVTDREWHYQIDYLSEKKFHQEYFVQSMPDIFYYIFGTFFRLGMIQGIISVVLFLLVVVSVILFLVKMKRRVSKVKKNRK